jgi:hypothetical protein
MTIPEFSPPESGSASNAKEKLKRVKFSKIMQHCGKCKMKKVKICTFRKQLQGAEGRLEHVRNYVIRNFRTQRAPNARNVRNKGLNAVALDAFLEGLHDSYFGRNYGTLNELGVWKTGKGEGEPKTKKKIG